MYLKLKMMKSERHQALTMNRDDEFFLLPSRPRQEPHSRSREEEGTEHCVGEEDDEGIVDTPLLDLDMYRYAGGIDGEWVPEKCRRRTGLRKKKMEEKREE
jgi:hypothetical protein